MVTWPGRMPGPTRRRAAGERRSPWVYRNVVEDAVHNVMEVVAAAGTLFAGHHPASRSHTDPPVGPGASAPSPPPAGSGGLTDGAGAAGETYQRQRCHRCRHRRQAGSAAQADLRRQSGSAGQGVGHSGGDFGQTARARFRPGGSRGPDGLSTLCRSDLVGASRRRDAWLLDRRRDTGFRSHGPAARRNCRFPRVNACDDSTSP